MHTIHPLWRGFWLAAAIAAVRYLLGPVDSLAPFSLRRSALVYAAGIAGGALLAALPSVFRKRRLPRLRTSWQRCLRAFLCGGAMALALGMAGSGSILPALLTSSAGAVSFGAAALAGGLVTVRILERRRRT